MSMDAHETIGVKSQMLKMHDDEPIKVARFEPGVFPVGVVHILHGFGEHIDLYAELAGRFMQNNFACVIHDQRGHGEMPGLTVQERKRKLGKAPDYESFLKDIDTIRSHIGTWYPNLPVFLYGHSMGGNIALNYILKYPQENYKKVVLESPWLRLYKTPSKAERLLVRIVGGITGNIVYDTKLNIDSVACDEGFTGKLKADNFYHGLLSFRLLTQIMDSGEYGLANAGKVKIPLLLLCAGKDKLVCSQSIRDLANNAGENVIIEEYLDSGHSLHSDLNKIEVFDRALSFIMTG